MKLSMIILALTAAVVIASPNPVAEPQKEPTDPCDECDRHFIACKNASNTHDLQSVHPLTLFSQSWACCLDPANCDHMCNCQTKNYKDVSASTQRH
jgi:hypothetical protein